MSGLIEDYGQAIILVIFGGGVVTMMGKVLSWILTNAVIA